MAGEFVKAQVKLVYLKFDADKVRKDLKEVLETQNRQAVRAWLKAIVIDNKLPPVWTGMARGSLKPLGQFLRVAIPINPSSSPRAQAAIRAGQNEGAGAALGHFKLAVEGKARVIFEFKTGVIHYFINEFYDVSDKIHLIEPVPWHSFDIGEKAYKDYIEANLFNKLPKLHSYITRYTLTTHE